VERVIAGYSLGTFVIYIMSRNSDVEFRKSCVKLRLQGLKVKDICVTKKIHPPQLLKWMKEFAEDPEFKTLQRTSPTPRQRHTEIVAPKNAQPIPRKPDGKIDWAQIKWRGSCPSGLHVHGITLHFGEKTRGVPASSV